MSDRRLCQDGHVVEDDGLPCIKCEEIEQERMTETHHEHAMRVIAGMDELLTAKDSELASLKEENENIQQMLDKANKKDIDLSIDLERLREDNEQSKKQLAKSIDRELELEAALNRLSVQLRAWHEVFGTQQLTHASARLEASEKEVERLRGELAEAKHWWNQWQAIAKDWMDKSDALESRLKEAEGALCQLSNG